VLEARILEALAYETAGDREAALDALRQAVEIGAPGGFVQVFVDAGDPLATLLRELVAQGLGGPHAVRLIAAFRSPPGLDVRDGGLVEPLTPREVEILRLVAAGMRNLEIADCLVISIATVKRHIANAYGKLGVGHRTEAVAKMADLDLL
jgi:LuxR family maltose regulon positive regulatory protein